MSTLKSMADLAKLNSKLTTAKVEEQADETEEVMETNKPRKGTGKDKVEKVAVKIQETDNNEHSDANLSEDDSDQDSENTLDESVPEGYHVEEEREVVQETVVPLKYKKCHVCRHLFPTIPDSLPSKWGGNGKAYGKEFECFTEDGCPAQYLRFIFNPLTDEIVADAVKSFLDTGYHEKLTNLYDQAKEISESVWQDLHVRVTEMLKNR